MAVSRTRRRRQNQRALRVIRSPARQEHQQFLSETPQPQPVIVLPAEIPAVPELRPLPAPPPPASVATTQRLLLVHAQRTRHLLSHRSVVATLTSSQRREMVEQIAEMKRTIRTLETELEVTPRNVEAMERLTLQLHRLTDGLRQPRDDTANTSASTNPRPGTSSQ